MEILAPAGSIDMLKMAVRHGADAVYLGLSSFSARAKATDFTQDNLAETAAYCRKHGVKAYLTLNTVVLQSEMPEALHCVQIAAQSGVDAILVQDSGFAARIRRICPAMPIHASTQMGIHNVPGALYAKRLGFTRVVLARETPLEDIRAIKRETGLEVEVFVHGALCVSFSGNCYYSSLVSGCSGNRGKCLQLCRKNYTTDLDGSKKRGSLLSPADLCLVGRVLDLIDAGVDSIKIEGRLKRPEYAGVTVDVYKKAVCGQSATASDYIALKSVYNRGNFCEGYLDFPNASDFVGSGLPGHAGVEIGQIEHVGRGSFIADSNVRLSGLDGFKIVRNGTEVGGATHPKSLGNDRYRFSTLSAVAVGDAVFRTTDAALNALQSPDDKKIALSLSGWFFAGQKPELSGRLPDRTVAVRGSEPLPKALDAPMTVEDLTANLKKLGGTDYVAEKIEVTTDSVFLPKSVLNGLRRALVEELDRSFCKPVPVLEDGEPMHSEYGIQSRFSRYYVCHNTEQIEYAQTKTDAAIVFSPESYESIPNGNGKMFLELPVIARGCDLARIEAQTAAVKSYAGIVANNVYAIELARGFGMKVIAGFGLNVTNYEWTEHFCDVFFSVENLSDNRGAVAFGLGEFPLMTVAHCPFRVSAGKTCVECASDKRLTYTDERGKSMIVRRKKIEFCSFTLNDFLAIPSAERHRRLVINLDGTTARDVVEFERGEEIPGSYFGKRLK